MWYLFTILNVCLSRKLYGRASFIKVKTLVIDVFHRPMSQVAVILASVRDRRVKVKAP